MSTALCFLNNTKHTHRSSLAVGFPFVHLSKFVYAASSTAITSYKADTFCSNFREKKGDRSTLKLKISWGGGVIKVFYQFHVYRISDFHSAQTCPELTMKISSAKPHILTGDIKQ